ncbi:MAG: carboxypeptidase regulatory-like domain-containing protein [Thermoplasmatota archaeon]
MRTLFVTALLLATVLAGCADDDQPTADELADGAPEIQATSTTGGIRGVVVDESIRPVPEALVVLNSGETANTDEAGLFVFSGLPAGEYFLRVEKFGYQGTQSTTNVVAGVTDPKPVKLVMQRLIGVDPYISTFKFEGFYECAFALPFITDSCDFGWRTVVDEMNATVGNPAGLPRNLQANANTDYLDIDADLVTIVQESAFEGVDSMMISLASTPIDNACDCSELDYLEVIGPSPTYGRIDGEQIPHGVTAAVRGFLPFGDPQYALNVPFQIFTTYFHNAPAPEGWSFVSGDESPF